MHRYITFNTIEASEPMTTSREELSTSFDETSCLKTEKKCVHHGVVSKTCGWESLIFQGLSSSIGDFFNRLRSF